MSQPINANNPIKILFLLPDPDVGGGMTAITKMYYDAKAFQNSDIRHFDTSFKWGNNFVFRLAEFFVLKARFIFILLKFRPKVISVMTSSYWGFYDKIIYCALARIFNIKSMLNPVGGGFSDFYLSNNFNRKLVNYSMKIPDCLLIGSSFWLDFFTINFPGIKLFNLPNPVNTALFHHTNTEDNKFIRIVTISNIIEEKGLKELTEVIKAVCSINDKIQFVVMGGGNLLNYMKTDLKEFASTNQVQIMGVVSDETKIDELSKADLFILLSHFELIPISVLEAMASSLPVLSTDVGGIPDLIENNVNGFLVKKNQTEPVVSIINKLSDKKELLHKMGQLSREKVVSGYDINKILKLQIEYANNISKYE